MSQVGSFKQQQQQQQSCRVLNHVPLLTPELLLIEQVLTNEPLALFVNVNRSCDVDWKFFLLHWGADPTHARRVFRR